MKKLFAAMVSPESLRADTVIRALEKRQKKFEASKCGLLEHGFLRVKCDGCQHEHLVAFSCKRRGFCPSCGARRMVESAAHLVDHVFPEVPVRQFVLTYPFPLRFLLAAEPQALTAYCQINRTKLLESAHEHL